jgi:uncharacterized membrane protein YqaE (UPF0057 family)
LELITIDLSYAIFSPIVGVGLIAGIIKNDYAYVNNGLFLTLIFFLSVVLAIYFFLKSFNVLIIDSFGIELKYLLFPSKSIKKRWAEINNYAIVRIKREGSRKQITYSRSELWFIDSNDMVLFKTYKKGRTNLNHGKNIIKSNNPIYNFSFECSWADHLLCLQFNWE